MDRWAWGVIIATIAILFFLAFLVITGTITPTSGVAAAAGATGR